MRQSEPARIHQGVCKGGSTSLVRIVSTCLLSILSLAARLIDEMERSVDIAILGVVFQPLLGWFILGV